MEIFGLGLVGVCMFVGTFIGDFLGKSMGIKGNIGGVGFAMLLLVFISGWLEDHGKPLTEGTKSGIKLLSGLYIPIVVAMSAIQDVVSAFNGGLLSFLAGGVATIGSLLLLPLIMKVTGGKK